MRTGAAEGPSLAARRLRRKRRRETAGGASGAPSAGSSPAGSSATPATTPWTVALALGAEDAREANVDAEADEGVLVDRNEAYREHLELVLRTVFVDREDYRELADETERETARVLLEEASLDAKSLLARIFPRRGPWFRASQLAKYFLPRRVGGQIPDPAQAAQNAADAAARAEKALLELCDLGFARRFDGQNAGLEEALSLAEAVLTGPELQLVLKHAKLDGRRKSASADQSASGGRRRRSSSDGGTTKAAAVARLRDAGKSQRTVFGRGLPVARIIGRVATDEMVALQTRPQALLQRAFSLYYLTASMSSFQRVQEASSTRTQGEATSLHFPGLLASFGKLRFAEYVCKTAWPIFRDRAALDAYEVAVALRAWLEAWTPMLPSSSTSMWPSKATSRPRDEEAGVEVEHAAAETAAEIIDLLSDDDNDTADVVPVVANDCKVETRGQKIGDRIGAVACNKENEGTQGVSFFRLRNNVVQELGLDTRGPEGIVNQLIVFLRECIERGPSSEAPAFLAQFRADYVLSEAISFGIEWIEKEHKYEVAAQRWRELLDLQPAHRRRGYWWNRLSIDQKHLGQPQAAAETLTACLQDPGVPQHSAHRDEAQKRLAKILKNRAVEAAVPGARAVLASHEANDETLCHVHDEVIIFGRRRTSTTTKRQARTGERCEFFSADDKPSMYCHVEEFVLEHFEQTEGWLGLHCEGQIFRSLFAVFMWDAIFDESVLDVFQTPFQHGPLDLFHCSGLFAAARRDRIEDLLREIGEMGPRALAQRVRDAWEAHEGVQVCGMRWNAYPCETLACVAACIGPTVLQAIFRRLCEDYNHWAGGGPDLLLYRVSRGPPDAATAVRPVDVLSKPLVDVEEQERAKLWERRRGRVMRHVQPFAMEDATMRFEAWFLEVKSENDRLSHKQTSWLRYLGAAGAKAGVCHVKAPGDANE